MLWIPVTVVWNDPTLIAVCCVTPQNAVIVVKSRHFTCWPSVNSFHGGLYRLLSEMNSDGKLYRKKKKKTQRKNSTELIFKTKCESQNLPWRQMDFTSLSCVLFLKEERSGGKFLEMVQWRKNPRDGIYSISLPPPSKSEREFLTWHDMTIGM